MTGAEEAVVWGETAGQNDRIRHAVVEILESRGYEALQIREVARVARVSLARIYKLHRTRDELIVAALEWWMDKHRYAGLERSSPDAGELLHVGLTRVLHTIFQPWEQHPALLAAYFRARSGPGGERLIRRGSDAVVPVAMAALAGVDPEFVHDLDRILTPLVYGLVGRFAGGEIEVTAILPTVDRTVFWLTSGYEADRGRR